MVCSLNDWVYVFTLWAGRLPLNYI
jgi:hypothetical protein